MKTSGEEMSICKNECLRGSKSFKIRAIVAYGNFPFLHFNRNIVLLSCDFPLDMGVSSLKTPTSYSLEYFSVTTYFNITCFDFGVKELCNCT